MDIGIPKEVKPHEYRVGMIPSGVSALKKEGHRVFIESGSGEGSGFSDAEYSNAGAVILPSASEVYKRSSMIVKVKEPVSEEYEYIKDGQIIFAFLHLAPNMELIDMLLKKKAIAIGYETVESDGDLPLLRPMSEIAGRLAPLMGAYYLQRPGGGAGLLMSGVPGVMPAKVVVLGAGTVGYNAARIAVALGACVTVALGACVTVLNRGIERLVRLDELMEGSVVTLISSPENIENEAVTANILIGAVLISGQRAPMLVSRELVSRMKKGSVIVDVSVDQGGCVETTVPTTHDKPVFSVNGVIHYCVTNMPGIYPRTATIALTNRTLPYIIEIASSGMEKAVRENPALYKGVNLYAGRVIHNGLALSLGVEAEVVCSKSSDTSGNELK
ncbi:MAG: alanine dehydrogenase [Nitrospirae bacterium]|nr:alanine dehydrogenase [Nitrospirota bacterium]